MPHDYSQRYLNLFIHISGPLATFVLSMGHIDDSFLVGYDYTACNNNVKVTVDTLLKLGFVIHPEKSVFIPTQEIEFLGFLLDSVSMTIRLPPAKAERVRPSMENKKLVAFGIWKNKGFISTT